MSGQKQNNLILDSLMLSNYHRIAATWDKWGTWDGCSATCGNGTKIRVKECVNPDFNKTGISCDGDQPQASHVCNDGRCRKFLISV